jgi:hypothetical protein
VDGISRDFCNVVRPDGKLAVTLSVVQCNASNVTRSPAANVAVVVQSATAPLLLLPLLRLFGVVGVLVDIRIAVQLAGAISPTCNAIQSPLTNRRLGIVVHDAEMVLEVVGDDDDDDVVPGIGCSVVRNTGYTSVCEVN